jgi:hypothetical protein
LFWYLPYLFLVGYLRCITIVLVLTVSIFSWILTIFLSECYLLYPFYVHLLFSIVVLVLGCLPAWWGVWWRPSPAAAGVRLQWLWRRNRVRPTSVRRCVTNVLLFLLV